MSLLPYSVSCLYSLHTLCDQRQDRMSLSVRTVSLLLAIYCVLSLAQAKSHLGQMERQWNVCSGAEVRLVCSNLTGLDLYLVWM